MIGAATLLPGTSLRYFRLDRIREAGWGDPSRSPMTVKILLEGLLREHEDGRVAERDVRALATWPAPPPPDAELAFRPTRVLLQDFTGVPAIVDLAAMREAMKRAGKDPQKIDPLIPVDLVIDHSVQVDSFGLREAYMNNIDMEYARNGERYAIFRWAKQAFRNFTVVPPGMGICHQVNLERLSRVVQVRGDVAIPDTLMGADSHTTMVNGLGVLGWGVGGIEAEAAMLGQPAFMPWPIVIGVRLVGTLGEGATATDLVLTVTELLRRKGVVEKFVEFTGPGLAGLAVADRATLSNMCPEYGATSALFPVDAQTLRYLALTGREAEHIALVETYTRAQGLFRTDDMAEPIFSDVVELDLATIEPSLAGPKRPQDRVPLAKVWESFTGPKPTKGITPPGQTEGPKPVNDAAGTMVAQATSATVAKPQARTRHVDDGDVVIAAITSCTNTSNPSVMIGAALLAKKAVERGLTVKPTVKTSFAPGSRVVTEYLNDAKLMPYLEKLGFYLTGYGCTVCIGNSGPLASPEIESAVRDDDLNVVAVLSGNRNFEGRIHPLVRSSYLASPPLVVAFALAGTVDRDLTTQPIGKGDDGRDVYLKEIWPSPQEVADVIARSVKTEQFTKEYGTIFDGDEHWRAMDAPTGALYEWDPMSTYVQEPPYFSEAAPRWQGDIIGARVLVVGGDNVTTDHISPAGSIPEKSPAGQWLIAQGVQKADFNQYGTRRGAHDVLVRGTFANVRFRNALAGEKEGWWTTHQPSGEEMTIHDAAARYRAEGTPIIALAGKEYGQGSSRDWAAKGPMLLGLRAVIAQSFERTHRANLIGMGIVPLEFAPGDSVATLGLDGRERFTLRELAGLRPKARVRIEAMKDDGRIVSFDAILRVDNATEAEQVRHGGILPLVLTQLIATA